jgi:hypothetical protein
MLYRMEFAGTFSDSVTEFALIPGVRQASASLENSDSQQQTPGILTETQETPL